MTEELKGIQRYYYRQYQNEYHTAYYVTPRGNAPLDVLNESGRFIVLTFDKDDDYIVVSNRRYYLNSSNSIKATNNVSQRICVVDLTELESGKSYEYDKKFKRSHTAVFANFDELKRIAQGQYKFNGSPYFKQNATWDEKAKKNTYTYTPSFPITML